MKQVVDTNVPLTANGAATHASQTCRLAAIDALSALMETGTIVLDDEWHILGEYHKKLRSSGQPGLGDAFLKWVLTHLSNPQRCERMQITPEGASFVEFPDDPQLQGFDQDDHKFVAVVLAHAARPPVLNAVDTDWWQYRVILEKHGVQVNFLCSEMSE